MIDHLSKKHGISKTWIAAQMHLTLPALHYAMIRGLTQVEAEQLEGSLRNVGAYLLAFSIPAELKYSEHEIELDSNSIFDEFKNICGISKTWIAEQLGLTRQGFDYAIERGLKEIEVEILEAVFCSMGRELANFTTPDHLLQKKEAA